MMKKYWIGVSIHWAMTLCGWYTLAAFAQGVADGTGSPSLPLQLFNELVRVFMAPLLLFVTDRLPDLGGFSIPSMLAFMAIAAVNSVIVCALILLLIRMINRSRPSS